MANKTIDDYFNLYEDHARADIAMDLFLKDNTNRDVYESVVNRTTELTGMNPVDNLRGRKHLTPIELRRFLDAWTSHADTQFSHYASKNIGDVLKEVDDDSIQALLSHVPPRKIKGHEKLHKIHADYSKYLGIAIALRKGSREDKESAIELVSKDARRLIKREIERKYENDKSNMPSDKYIKMVQEAFDFLGYLPSHAPELYLKEAEEVYESIKKEPKDRIRDYVSKTILASDKKEKEDAFRFIHKTLKDKK